MPTASCCTATARATSRPAGEAFRSARRRRRSSRGCCPRPRRRPRIETYPGGETYGPFLRVETEKTPAATFTTFLCPQPYQNPNLLRNGGFEHGMAGWQPRANEDLPNHNIVADNPPRASSAPASPGAATTTATSSACRWGHGHGPGQDAHRDCAARMATTITLYFWRDGRLRQRQVGPISHDEWRRRLTALSPRAPNRSGWP